jgi:hypothetical protein
MKAGQGVCRIPPIEAVSGAIDIHANRLFLFLHGTGLQGVRFSRDGGLNPVLRRDARLLPLAFHQTGRRRSALNDFRRRAEDFPPILSFGDKPVRGAQSLSQIFPAPAANVRRRSKTHHSGASSIGLVLHVLRDFHFGAKPRRLMHYKSIV